MRWHRLLQMVVVMFTPFLLSGCWSSLELRDTGMVTGIGIDKLENGQYRLILQLLSATDKEGEKEASSSPIMLSQTGTSLFEIQRSLIRDAKRRLMFMHTKVILMGESAARDNLLWPLDTWARDTQPPLMGYLLISKEDISSISDTPTGFPENPFFAWSKGMDNIAFTVKVIRINLEDLLKQLSEPPYVSYVPMVRTVTSRGKSHLQFEGTALIQGQHMVGELDSQETQGLVWLLGKERGGSIEAKNPNSGDTYVLEAGRESMKTHVAMRRSELYVDTTIRIPGTIAQSVHANPMDPKQLATMETLFTREVYCTTNRTLADLQSRKVDALGIGLRLYRQDPKTWHRVEKQWGEIFSKGHFTLHITVEARHPGLIRSIYPHV